MTDPMRVAVVPERYGRVLSPCASIRLQPFFDAMKTKAGMEFRYLLPTELRRYSPDVVVWHRVSITDKRDLETLVQLRQQRATRLIFDLDDNLLDLEGHGERASYEAMSESVRVSIELADEVWTSTSRLAARAARETRAVIKVLPNTLDPELWGPVQRAAPVRRKGAPLRLLYMGTRTHDADFALLEQALIRLQSERPGCFELSVVGVRTRDGVAPAWLRTLNPPPHVGASYPAFVAWFSQLSGFDLGVAPLLSSAFNDCKSPIKVLDYAAIGLPTLASSVPAYTDSLRTGLDCLHAENDAAAWSRALREIASNCARLSSVAEHAKRLVAPEAFAEGVRLRHERIVAAKGQ
ncbi:MAG: glycosyltransferase [Frankiaceae bacterium]|nr:glycosyltransferase [Arenimonas sp.]